jgi:TRAP-type C4-dicarboxylate transport system substrate-binding protein
MLAACLAVGLALPVHAQGSPEGTTTEWRLSTALGPAYPQGWAGKLWADLIRERSGGRLEVKVFPGAALVQRDPAREFGALRDGAIDLAVGSAAIWAVQVRELNLVALPWLVPDRDALDRLLRSDVAARLSAAVLAAGVMPLAWAGDGFRELATRRPVHLPAELNGLSLRAPYSPLLIETLQGMGAAPRTLNAADASRGPALDGEETSVASYAAARLYVSGYSRLLLWGAHADALIFAIHRGVWERLSQSDRELVAEAARDAAQRASAMARRLSDRAALEELSRQGVTVTRLTPAGKQRFREAVRPVYDRWAAVVGADLVREAEAAVAASR